MLVSQRPLVFADLNSTMARYKVGQRSLVANSWKTI